MITYTYSDSVQFFGYRTAACYIDYLRGPPYVPALSGLLEPVLVVVFHCDRPVCYVRLPSCLSHFNIYIEYNTTNVVHHLTDHITSPITFPTQHHLPHFSCNISTTNNRPLHFLQKLQTPAERGSAIHMEHTTHMTHFFLISLCPPIIPPTLRIVYILHCE